MNTRVLKLATAAALIASLASVGTVSARYTGADYCATKNAKGEWALVGGAACNKTASSNPNASWNEAWIIDFDAFTATDAYHPATVRDLGDDLHDALTTLNASYVTLGWMYVANKGPNSTNVVYLMVKTSACAGNSEWFEAPACE